MLELVRHEAEVAGFGEDELKQIELAAEEVLVNIITHGYPTEGEGDVEILCESPGRRSLRIVFRDHAAPFNPLDREAPASLNASLEERPIGGLGLHFVKELMDQVTYERESDANVLTLVKHSD